MPLKIALLSPNESKYSETFIRNHKEMLAGEVFYYYGRGSGNPLPVYLHDKRNIILPVLTIPFLFKILNKLFPTWLKRMQLEGLKKSFETENIQLVFCEYGTTGAETYALCKQLNLPMIVHFHGYDASINSVIEKYRDRYREMFQYASYIIVVSQLMKDTLINLGASPSKIIVNPCGPAQAFFNVWPHGGSRQLISVGRFVEKKSPLRTIEAFALAHSIYPDLKLVMCGNGPLLKSCRDLVKKKGLTGAVTFEGQAAPHKIRTYFKGSFAYIQHSVRAANGDMEGTPVAILEASASGLPVISTRHAGIPDVIIEGKTGILVDEGDVITMAKAISWLVENPKSGREMGEEGRRNIGENFSIKHHIKILDTAIAEAVAGSHTNQHKNFPAGKLCLSSRSYF